jgi:uncharacterized protein YbcI
MAEKSDSPRLPDGIQPDDSLLSAISREMVRTMKTYYGKGPEKAKSYLVDDLLFIVMRGGGTVAEQTMIDAGQEDAVRDFRQRFENEMSERLTYMVEQLTKRKVINYQSQILFDPDISIEIFVFDKPIAEEAREETAEALMDPERGVGEVSGDEVEAVIEQDVPETGNDRPQKGSG